MSGRGKQSRGFASMDKEKQRAIASKGGKKAHAIGAAHEWTTKEAREAGRKGGMATHKRKANADAASDVSDATVPADKTDAI